MGKKIRVDQLLVERGLVESREKAKTTIMAGHVFSNGQRIDKPGTKVEEDLHLEVKGNPIPYVGRGGLKLEKALKYFDLDLNDRTMIDVGASTGGFTDCALQNGAKRSYAVDVGYNQLAWKLRNDNRVVVMDRTNFRYMTPEQLSYELPDFAAVDVSFISLKLILNPLYQLLTDESDALVLIKPQFEAGKEQVGKKGIVRDHHVHEEVVSKILTYAETIGFQIAGLTYSPITGGDGNIEFLAWLKKSDEQVAISYPELIQTVVEEAHKALVK